MAEAVQVLETRFGDQVWISNKHQIIKWVNFREEIPPSPVPESSPITNSQIEDLVELLTNSRRTVVITGAGMQNSYSINNPCLRHQHRIWNSRLSRSRRCLYFRLLSYDSSESTDYKEWIKVNLLFSLWQQIVQGRDTGHEISQLGRNFEVDFQMRRIGSWQLCRNWTGSIGSLHKTSIDYITKLDRNESSNSTEPLMSEFNIYLSFDDLIFLRVICTNCGDIRPRVKFQKELSEINSIEELVAWNPVVQDTSEVLKVGVWIHRSFEMC